MKRSSMKRGSMKRGSMKRGSVKRGSVKRGSVKRGATRKRIVALLASTALFAGLGATVGFAAPAGAAVSRNPVGHLDSVSAENIDYGGDGRVHFTGWAADPDLGRTAGMAIRFYVDGTYAGETDTHLSRPDVARVYPQYGSTIGFSAAVPMSPGQHTVCTYAINRGPGSNSSFGCRRVHTDWPGYVVGHIDSITVTNSSPQKVIFRGWALDPTDHSQKPLMAGVGQGSDVLVAFTTGIARPDVAKVYPGRNARSGFEVTSTEGQTGGAFVAGSPTCIFLYSLGFGQGLELYQQAPGCSTFPATNG